jgi:hypothetical protein
MPYGTVNADVIQTSTSGGILGAGNASIMKNRIINGAMVINQRALGTTTINSGSAWVYTLDRWSAIGESALGVYTLQQSSTAPAGFVNSLLATVTTSATPGASNLYVVRQVIEGNNLYDLGWGTANAKTVTLSFQVYSSLTGTFGGVIKNGAENRSYPFTYTVASANTWTSISVTIAGDTSGTWTATTGAGMNVYFSLGAGSSVSGTAGAWAGSNFYGATGQTNIIATNGATFYITACQLEVGSSATGFEYVNYQTSLANCQRYYQKNTISYGAANGTTTLAVCYQFPVYMRVAPTCSLLTSTPYAELAYLTGFTASGATLNVHNFTGGTDFQVSGFTGMTQYRAPMFLDANQIGLSAEL